MICRVVVSDVIFHGGRHRRDPYGEMETHDAGRQHTDAAGMVGLIDYDSSYLWVSASWL